LTGAFADQGSKAVALLAVRPAESSSAEQAAPEDGPNAPSPSAEAQRVESSQPRREPQQTARTSDAVPGFDPTVPVPQNEAAAHKGWPGREAFRMVRLTEPADAIQFAAWNPKKAAFTQRRKDAKILQFSEQCQAVHLTGETLTDSRFCFLCVLGVFA
jgi:hypothetical protein